MVYVSRLIRHPRPGFRFLQAPLNQACGAQNQWLVYLQKRFCTKRILSKKGSVQKSSIQKRFAIPEIALTTTSPPSIENMLGVIPLVSALKAQSGLRHHRAFQDSKPVQVCSFIASTSINTRKRCRSQMNQRTTFRTNTHAIMPLHRPNKAHSLTSQSSFTANSTLGFLLSASNQHA